MPMTLLERATRGAADFRKRLESAQMIVAAEVLSEDPVTASHAQRLVRMIASAPQFSDKVTEDVSGSTITDLNLESAVATFFTRMR